MYTDRDGVEHRFPYLAADIQLIDEDFDELLAMEARYFDDTLLFAGRYLDRHDELVYITIWQLYAPTSELAFGYDEAYEARMDSLCAHSVA